MTAAEHPVLPRQSTPPDDGLPPQDRRRMIRRRLITATIIVLLIGIPVGYLLISAGQSRRAGQNKEAEASAQGLREGWPSRMQRRIFELPMPGNSLDVQYYETNNWKAEAGSTWSSAPRPPGSTASSAGWAAGAPTWSPAR